MDTPSTRSGQRVSRENEVAPISCERRIAMKKFLSWSLLALALGVPAVALAANAAGLSLGCCPLCP
jgi:hypothetical protein